MGNNNTENLNSRYCNLCPNANITLWKNSHHCLMLIYMGFESKTTCPNQGGKIPLAHLHLAYECGSR